MIDATSRATGIIARRDLGLVSDIGHMLIKRGYECRIEMHCKFWLLHWKFPSAVRYTK